MKKINVCLSPPLYEYYADNSTVVIMIDAIRASATICTAFMNDVQYIVPVAEVKEAQAYKSRGFKIAGERNGKKPEGFDFGNSPFNFTKENIKGEKLAFTTTNGTQVINLVKNDKHKNIDLLVGSFLNISALTKYLLKQNKNILILCSGWKNTVNVEDTLFAGRLVHLLSKKDKYEIPEASNLALTIYNNAENSYFDFVINNSPRLKSKLDFLEKDIRYCLTEDLTSEIPFLQNDKLMSVSL